MVDGFDKPGTHTILHSCAALETGGRLADLEKPTSHDNLQLKPVDLACEIW